MKVSIITVCYNSAATIEDTIKSVLSQTYPNIEHIIIDGGSTDGTLDVIERYRKKVAVVVSEPDRGIYDAMNKGIARASGDIIGTLNADDFYAYPDVIESVVRVMEQSKADVCWGDLEYVSFRDTTKVVRYWRSSEYAPGKFRRGWHPPHPTFFVRTRVYEKYGTFNIDFKIAADYELMLRLLEKHRVHSAYIARTLVKMRTGGASNFWSPMVIFRANAESYRAWKINNLPVHWWSILAKPFSKLIQLIKKR